MKSGLVSGRLSKLKTAIDAAGNHGKTIQTVERPGSVKAKFFTEGANHPTHPKADEDTYQESHEVGGKMFENRASKFSVDGPHLIGKF
ncbi:hypothetical protein Tco_1315162 [Tanacetum coccineum]